MTYNFNSSGGPFGMDDDPFQNPPFVMAARAPTTNDIRNPGTEWQDNSVSPAQLYQTIGSGIWYQGSSAPATTTTFGTVQLATLSELQNGNAPAGAIVPLSNDVATVIAGIVVGAVPPATETQQGIAEIATQVETDAGTDDTRIVTPLKLANFVASGGFPGVFTDLTATGTVSFTGATGGITMTSATASSFGTTGAGIDLTLSSASGRVVVNGEEAAADAVRILSAAGGLDTNVALQMNLDSSQSAVNAVRIVASDAAGGIDIDSGTGGITVDSTGAFSIDGAAASNVTTTGAGIDLTLSSVLGSVLVSSTENAALAIYLHADGGTSETIRLRADQGTGAASVELISDVGGVTLTGGTANATAINLTTSNAAGGITLTTGTGGVLTNTNNGVFTLASGTGTIGISADAAATTVNIATGAAVKTLTLGSTNSTSATTLRSGSGALAVTSTGGTLTINSGVGALGVSTDASATTVSLATGAAVKTVTLGSTNSTSATTVQSGSGALAVTSTGGTLTVNSGVGALSISTDAAATTVAIATGAGVKGLTLGSTNTTSSTTLQSGSGALAVTSTGGTLTINSGVGALGISTDASATAVSIGTGAAVVKTIAIGGTGANVITLANTQTAGSFSLGDAMTTGTINIGSGAAVAGTGIITISGGTGAQTTNIANGTGGKTVSIATGAGANTLTLGSTNSTSTTTINSGSGNVNITGGNLKIATTGKGLQVKGGVVTDMCGTGVLTLGTQTIANTNIATGDLIFISRISAAGSLALGVFSYTISNATSFTVTSLGVTTGTVLVADVSTYAYFIVRPV